MTNRNRKSNRQRRRLIRVEQLEPRAMLAGNVSVSVNGGNLLVTGDNSDNAVLIEQVGNGQYAVTGFDLADTGEPGFQSGPTRINGQSNGTVVVSGVTGDIIADLRKGSDILAIGNSEEELIQLAEECGIAFGIGEEEEPETPEIAAAAIVVEPVAGRFFAPRNLIVNSGDGHDAVIISADVKQSLIVNTGAGNDAVAIGNSSSVESDALVGGSVIVTTGGGHDDVCVQYVSLNGLLSIQTGDGNDSVVVDQLDAGSLHAITAGGHDFVSLDDLDTDREIIVNTGAGNDFALLDDFSAGQGFGPAEQRGAGFVTVLTGAGNDQAELTDFSADGVLLDTGAGNDGTPNEESPITVEDASITGYLTILTGGGNDLLVVEFVEAGDVTINTGEGHDGSSNFPVEIYNVLFDSLTVVTGGGADYLYIHAGNGEDTSAIAGDLVVDTGAGNDVVQIIEQVIGRDLIVALGGGNDLAAIGSDDGIGEGTVETGMTVRRNLVVNAGAGNDGVGIGGIDVLNDVFAYLGAGNDFLFMFNSEAGGNLLIDAGAGNDDVEIEDSFIAGDAQILMGAGNDELSIFSSNGNGRLRLFGGLGTDTLNNDLGIEANGEDGDVEVRQFEIFNFID